MTAVPGSAPHVAILTPVMGSLRAGCVTGLWDTQRALAAATPTGRDPVGTVIP